MNPHQQEEVTTRAEISKTPPGLMFGPASRAGLFCVVFEAPEKGPEVRAGNEPSYWGSALARLGKILARAQLVS